MQVEGSAVDESSNALLGIVRTRTPLQFNPAKRQIQPAANLRRSNRRPTTYFESEIKAVNSTKRRGRHGPTSKSSEFRVVTYYKGTRRLEAHIRHDNGQVYISAHIDQGIGSQVQRINRSLIFKDQTCSRGYDMAALMLTGPGADINFKAEAYAGHIAMLRKLTMNQIVIHLRRESCGGRKQATFRGVKEIRKDKAFLATYKQDPKENSSPT